MDAQALSIQRGRLRAVVMIDVLHHVPDVSRFFSEAARAINRRVDLVVLNQRTRMAEEPGR